MPFDPYITRAEKTTTFLTRANGIDVWFDNTWHARDAASAGGAGVYAYPSFTQDVYRWFYEHRKLEVTNGRRETRAPSPRVAWRRTRDHGLILYGALARGTVTRRPSGRDRADYPRIPRTGCREVTIRAGSNYALLVCVTICRALLVHLEQSPQREFLSIGSARES